MHLLQNKVRDVLQMEEAQGRWQEKIFDVNRMIRAFGDWTLGKLHFSLKGTIVLCCAKEHEEKKQAYEYCKHFGSNLVCGHLLHTQNAISSPLRNAGGIIATAVHVVDQCGSKISDQCIPVLEEIVQRSHLLDGAAYVAFDKLRDHPPGHFTNVPDSYRQPELEACQDLPALRAAIINKEKELASPILELRNAVLDAYEAALHISQNQKVALRVIQVEGI